MKLLKCLWIVVLCLCLCGCDLLSRGSHIYVGEHQNPSTGSGNQNVNARNYQQLYKALVNMVEKGEDQKIIFVKQYDKQQLDADLQQAVATICAEKAQPMSCTRAAEKVNISSRIFPAILRTFIGWITASYLKHPMKTVT